MSLVSYEFGAFFLILLCIYYIIPGKCQWVILLSASILFYASGGVFYLLYPLITIVSTWLLAGVISRKQLEAKQYVKEHELSKDEKKAYNRRAKAARRRLMICGLLLNFGILAVIKYGDFVLTNVGLVINLFGVEGAFSPLGLVLPLGISYYTFQTMAYLIDVYHGKITHEKNLFRFALFASFFPQMVAGPISRFSDLKDQLYCTHTLQWENLKNGAIRILWGFFKKLVIADRMASAVLMITQDPLNFRGLYVLVGAVGYTIWMYADFAGGIDIVIGAAEVLGIRLPENFNRPFFSKSLAEFWRRWHMTLMSWLREYIFFPVSTSKFTLGIMKKADKVFGKNIANRVPVYIATITVWLTAGIWHGASWKFVAWGMANCFVMLLSQELQPLYRSFHNRFSVDGTNYWKLFQVMRTCLLFAALEMFEYYSFTTVFEMAGSFLTQSSFAQLIEMPAVLGLSAVDIVILFASVIVLIFVSLSERRQDVRKTLAEKPVWLQYSAVFMLFLIVLVAGVYGYGFSASQFVYNQF